MTNNNFNNLIGYFLANGSPTLSSVISNSGILKYNGTVGTSSSADIRTLNSLFYPRVAPKVAFGEAYDDSLSDVTGIFLTLGTDDTPPTHSDLKLGNSVENFVCLSYNKVAGIETNSNDLYDLLIFNGVVKYKGSSPIIIKEMGLNCVIFGNKFLLARETIEPLVINPDDVYSFTMRIK